MQWHYDVTQFWVLIVTPDNAGMPYNYSDGGFKYPVVSQEWSTPIKTTVRV